MLEIFINNNSFLESNSKYIFRDTGFIHNPPFAFRTNYLLTNFSTVFNNPYSFSHITYLKTLHIFFLVGFI